jgi:hypothetical protein
MGLFVTDELLKERLRLSRLPESSGAVGLLQEAVMTVRLGFFQELGGSRVSQLQAIPFTETPATANELLRAQAHAVEVKWVRYELSRTLPMLFADGNNDNGQIFHDEAAFRRAADSQLESMRAFLWEEIVVGLGHLSSSGTVNDQNRHRFGAITPNCSPPAPGDSWRRAY